MKRFGWGLAVGLVLGSASVALAYPFARDGDGDHYESGWTVLVRGETLCLNPYVRPSEREIECRSRQSP